MIKIDVQRTQNDYGFTATDAFGNRVQMDTSPESGGNNYGFRPMQLLLATLGGCSGIDVISILKKQRQPVESFEAHIEGEREPGAEPSLFTKATIIFNLKGNIDAGKAHRACELSIEKYCSVAETLRLAGCTISWQVRINEQMKLAK